MSRYTVQISNEGVVEIWDNENPNENNAPFFRQDTHPDGRPWANKAEAEAWVAANHDTPVVEETPTEDN